MRRLTLLASLAVLMLSANVFAQSGPYQYFPLSPCRAVDTRGNVGNNGGPKMGQDTFRNFQMRGVCGVPTTAKAVSLNVTITEPTQASWLAIWPSGTTRPNVSMINFEPADPALANGIIVGVSTATQDLSIYNNWGSVHVLVDVTGYFQ
jgi:hypothetical protein